MRQRNEIENDFNFKQDSQLDREFLMLEVLLDIRMLLTPFAALYSIFSPMILPKGHPKEK